MRALQHRWDVVPVIIQDAVWERSFPDVAGVVIRLVDPVTGRSRLARLSRRDVAERRAANEERFTELMGGFHALDLEPGRALLVGCRRHPRALRSLERPAPASPRVAPRVRRAVVLGVVLVAGAAAAATVLAARSRRRRDAAASSTTVA